MEGIERLAIATPVEIKHPEYSAMTTPRTLPSKFDDDPVFDQSEPAPESLGEFAETIIDSDGELDPDALEEPEVTEGESSLLTM